MPAKVVRRPGKPCTRRGVRVRGRGLAVPAGLLHAATFRMIANADIADVLDRVADLLEAQGANPYRVRAYRGGARHVRLFPRSMHDVLETEGIGGLESIPGIGPSLAAAIRELIQTGRLRYLARLEGESLVETMLRKIPGIGPRTAHRLQAELGIHSLEELELAAHDGRLARLRGFGDRRIRAIRDSVAAALTRDGRQLRSEGRTLEPPDVAALLSVDEEYRVGCEIGALRRIAPRRFNPTGEAWLPILHTERGDWHFTATFSNTARAHERHTTHDWLVVHFERNGDDGQCTIVTETWGPLAGKRVVRGREQDCAAFYASTASAA